MTAVVTDGEHKGAMVRIKDGTFLRKDATPRDKLAQLNPGLYVKGNMVTAPVWIR